jgi:hypothetical protein
MNSLHNKPNLLFLIFVRNQNRSLLLSKLRRSIYRIKLIKALTVFKNKNGNKKWYINGKFHREDGPAEIWPDGSQFWCKNGELHREDGPAAIYIDGGEEWYLNNELHRDDGPAYINPDGTQLWYKNGKKHRQNGPNGTQFMFEYYDEFLFFI